MTFLTLILFWFINQIAYSIASFASTILFVLAISLVFGVGAIIAYVFKFIRGGK